MMNVESHLTPGAADLREAIRRMYVDGELDANTATRRLLTIDSQERSARGAGRDEAPAVGGT